MPFVRIICWVNFINRGKKSNAVGIGLLCRLRSKGRILVVVFLEQNMLPALYARQFASPRHKPSQPGAGFDIHRGRTTGEHRAETNKLLLLYTFVPGGGCVTETTSRTERRLSIHRCGAANGRERDTAIGRDSMYGVRTTPAKHQPRQAASQPQPEWGDMRGTCSTTRPKEPTTEFVPSQ